MKKIFILCCLGLFTNSTINAQTNRHNNLGAEEHLWKMKKISSSVFIAVGNGGSVLKYNTDCNDWLPLEISPNNDDDFRNISFPTTTTGYISGPSNAFYKTTNGGTSWTYISPTITGLTNASIQCVHFISADTGFIAGSQLGVTGGGRFIKRTTNGGNTWVDVTPATISTSTIYDMAFFQPGVGIAVATNNKAFKTTDNGITWTAITTPGTAYSVAVANSQIAVAVANGNIMRSTDQGLTWSSIATTATGLQGVSFFDANNGMITGSNGAILHTSDAGLTWNAVPTLLSQKVYDVVMTGANTGVAVGANGIVMDVDKNQTFHRLFDERFCHPMDSVNYVDYTNTDLTANANPRKWFFENVNEDENGLEASGWFPGKFAIYDSYYYEETLGQAAADSAFIETRALNLSGTTNLSLMWNEAFYTHVDFLSTTKIEGFNGTNWIPLYVNTGLDYGDGVASAVFPSNKRAIDISALAGVSNAKLRFYYVAPNTGDGFKNYWAVSDIEIRNQITDISVDSLVVNNATTCLLIQPVDIDIHISNVGDVDVFPLGFGWSSSDGQSGKNADYSQVAANNSFDMTLIDGFNPPSAGGVITIKAWIENIPNHNYTNDTITLDLTFVPSSGNLNGSLGNDTSLCPGNNIVLQTPSGTGNIVWSDGSNGTSITVSQAGDYYFSGTLNDCPITDSVYVDIYNVVTPVITLNGSDLSATQNNYTAIEWYKNGAIVITATGLYTLSNPETGDYTVVVTTNDGCEATSAVYSHTTVGIGNIFNKSNRVDIFPNPAKNQLTFDIGKDLNKECTVTVFDELGRLILSQKIDPKRQQQQLNISHLQEGIYFIKIADGNIVYNGSFTKLK